MITCILKKSCKKKYSVHISGYIPTTKTALHPATGKDAIVVKQPHARDEVETELETTGMELVSKNVIVTHSSI